MDAFVISPVVPYALDNGHKQAIASDLTALESVGLKTGVFAYLYRGEPDCQTCVGPPLVDAVYVRRGSRAVRLVRSYFGTIPAAAERFYTREARQRLILALRRYRPRIVVIEDVVLAGWLPLLREVAAGARVILRSHNMMNRTIRDFCYAAPPYCRGVLLYEHWRWNAFERRATFAADQNWAITDADAEAFRTDYGHQATVCLPVAVDLNRYYIDPWCGDQYTFCHVGTIDARKSAALEAFVRTEWPRILSTTSQASLLIAGRVTIGTNLSGKGVTILGWVQSDVELYARARYALNTQTLTGGIKLKSLNAMAAARTLISTTTGVEGMDVKHGVHYWNLERLREEGDWQALMRDELKNLELARNAREWVSAVHSPEAVSRVLERHLGQI